jgi:hypothetical protein
MDKWLKAQLLLRELSLELRSQPLLDHKNLEKTRGFFNHLQRTYPSITPFLKGLHLTIDGWRGGRDDELWPTDADSEAEEDPTPDPSFSTPPKLVQPAPRLAADLKVLSLMFATPRPAIPMVRASKVVVALYGFADASGSGFGSSIQVAAGRTHIRYGMWGRDAEDKSSNYRELRNLVESIEANLSTLEGAELFLYTDNSTADSAYYRGNSTNKFLFELIVKLRLLDMTSSLRLHLLHIAGTRMVSQGTDAISRGTLPPTLIDTPDWASLVPLHLTAYARCLDLLPWLQSLIPCAGITPLAPEEWYTRGHGWSHGSLNADNIWSPVNSADSWLLWCGRPRLCTHLWRKKLFKVSDIVLEIPVGARPFWPHSMHEPLLVGLTLRFTSVPPWQLRLSPGLLALGRQLRYLWSDASGDERSLLQHLCLLPDTLECL